MVEAGDRLDRAVAAASDLSRARVQALVAEGRVRVEGDLATRAAQRVGAGARVDVEVPDPTPVSLAPEDLSLDIVYEDADLVVVDKPAGLVVHPARGHASGTLVHGLLHEVEDLAGIGGELRPGIVHRLDKGTSGLLVAAKNDAALESLRAQFAVHAVERGYLALVHGVPDLDGGRVDAPLGRDPRDRLRMAVVPGGRRAVTDWFVRERFDRASLFECRLQTGRTHQVRVHLLRAGHPILADPVYRDRRTPPPHVRAAIAGVDHPLLHAAVLGFAHPSTGAAIRFERPPPVEFQRVVHALSAG